MTLNIIKPKSTAAERAQFVAAVQALGGHWGWRLVHIDQNMYSWQHPDYQTNDHRSKTRFCQMWCTPFFEGYPRVCVTVNMWAAGSKVYDPWETGSLFLTAEAYNEIVGEYLRMAIERGHLPNTIDAAGPDVDPWEKSDKI